MIQIRFWPFFSGILVSLSNLPSDPGALAATPPSSSSRPAALRRAVRSERWSMAANKTVLEPIKNLNRARVGLKTCSQNRLSRISCPKGPSHNCFILLHPNLSPGHTWHPQTSIRSWCKNQWPAKGRCMHPLPGHLLNIVSRLKKLTTQRRSASCTTESCRLKMS